MPLSREEYRQKLLGCWMGKNIGGTLGAPMEWLRQVNNVSFYTQPLGGEPLPNDDLDLQLLWLVALEERGVELDAHLLADYWLLYITPHWSEYGTAKANLRSGIVPPLSGTLDNVLKDSCGSFIRSEIWAAIAPGRPELAVRYALQDSIVDHGDGEGTHAAVFCAAMESAAFVVSEIGELLEIGLSYIPSECGVARAVRDVMEGHRSHRTWRELRDMVLEKHRGAPLFNVVGRVSKEDQAKGFHEGPMGYDAPSNIALLVLALLEGGDDFARTVCTAVNCGEDTDCTAATAGALFGIRYGIEGIPPRWIEPIGRNIKTACLNLGELGHMGSQLAQNVDELTERTIRVERQVALRQGPRAIQVVAEDDAATDVKDVNPAALRCRDRRWIDAAMRWATYRQWPLEVQVEYPEGPFVSRGQPLPVVLHVRNLSKFQSRLSVRWHLPEGVVLSGESSRESSVMALPQHIGGPLPVAVRATLQSETGVRPVQRAWVELTADGRAVSVSVPVLLLGR